MTLSAPKSVSLLWALGDDRVAATVRQAHDEAVDAAIAYLDTEACLVRQGGRVRFPGTGLIAAGFRHRTSRRATRSCTPMSSSQTWPGAAGAGVSYRQLRPDRRPRASVGAHRRRPGERRGRGPSA
jgi:TrwC relaxase